jgi:ribonuclease P protein component
MPESAPARLRFPRGARLTETGEFRRVKEAGKTVGGRYLVLGVLKEAQPDAACRIGIVTSRRVGGAVVRNRVRRRLRELIRHTRPRLCQGAWVVVIARHLAARAALDELRADWLRLAARAAILAKEPEIPGGY